MTRLALAGGIAATIVVGLWASLVHAWLGHFDPNNFYE